MGGPARVFQALAPLASFMGPAGQVISAIAGASSLLNPPKQQQAPAPVFNFTNPTPAAPAATPAPTPAEAPKFTPQKPMAMGRPDTLSDLATFSPEQERSALATRGVQSGLGQQEDTYYKNLIQRSLIGDNNQVTGDTNSLLPVEGQYFSKQGMNTSDVMEFLRQLRGTT